MQDEDEDILNSIREKRTLRQNLQAELARLKADHRRLERIAETESMDITPRTLAALTTTRTRSRSDSPEIILPELITMPTDPIPHLSLFAPARLGVRISTKTTKQGPVLRQIHTINVTAPAPYPPHLFGATIAVTTDPQTIRIVSVKLVKWHGNAATQHAALQEWIETRLNGHLHGKDVSGLIWGMGSYWEFCLKRAHVWDTLTTTRLSDEESKPEELMRWLGRDSIEIEVIDGMSVLLGWTAQLDWTGGVEEAIGIACKGIPGKAHRKVAGVFEGLRRKHGVLKAVEGVLRLLRES